MKSDKIINNPDKWQGHPDVALFNSSVGVKYLFVTYRESEHHKTNEHTAIKVISAPLTGDDIVFSDPVTLFESGEDGRYNCPRLSVVNNELFCVVDYVKNDNSNFIAAENTEKNTEIHLTSTFDGSIWKDNVALNGVTGIVPDRLHSFNGQFILATHMARPSLIGHLATRLVQDVWINASDDPRIGEWQRHTLASDIRYNLCEASIFKMIDNQLGCVMRENSQKGLPAQFYHSVNGGKNWFKHRPTRLFGAHRPVMGKLKSGNYFVTYREQSSCFDVSCWARNTFSAIIHSDINGMPNFDRMNILPLDHDKSCKPDGGYTGWVELPDRSIYVVNYITNDSPKPYIKSYLLSEKDFCDESLEGDFF